MARLLFTPAASTMRVWCVFVGAPLLISVVVLDVCGCLFCWILDLSSFGFGDSVGDSSWDSGLKLVFQGELCCNIGMLLRF